jgi:hypothetical protein
VMSEIIQTHPNQVSSLREYRTVALSDSQLRE